MPETRTVIPVALPVLDEREADAARRPILSGWVTQGPEVAAFEREFAEYVGSDFACAVSNCTTALHLGLRAAGVGPGDEVITVSHSFIASANSIRYCGAVPVFVDIQPGTFNIDPLLVEDVISARTRAILCIHQVGMPCDLAALLPIARTHGLALIEDAACAIGSELLWSGAWEKVGKPHGDAACFSFHPRKLVTMGDGGMITTSHADWDRHFRLWRQHGMSVADAVRHGARDVIFESYDMLGYNFRLTDIQAAIGREQLKRLPELVARRRMLAQRYTDLLSEQLGLATAEEPSWARSNWQSYLVQLPTGRDQRAVMQQMLDQGVATRRAVMCAHREPAYATEEWSCGSGPGACGCAPLTCVRLAQSERAQDQWIVLPLFHQMTEEDQDVVIAALRAACNR
jgi:perosamine synthetase